MALVDAAKSAASPNLDVSRMAICGGQLHRRKKPGSVRARLRATDFGAMSADCMSGPAPISMPLIYGEDDWAPGLASLRWRSDSRSPPRF
jgi:hypothetical protein